jgi:hypothetical protein
MSGTMGDAGPACYGRGGDPSLLMRLDSVAATSGRSQTRGVVGESRCMLGTMGDASPTCYGRGGDPSPLMRLDPVAAKVVDAGSGGGRILRGWLQSR